MIHTNLPANSQSRIFRDCNCGMAHRAHKAVQFSRLVCRWPRSQPYSSSSSVDPTEVSHFNALASSWWEPHGSSRLLHLMNPLRHDFISTCFESQPEGPPSKKLRYLDVGCGGGIFAESAARLPTTAGVLGIDPSKDVIRVARTHATHDPLLLESGRLEYRNESIENLSTPRGPSQQFDILTLFEVVEHISNPAPFLSLCLPFVKPGGWLILSTIARTWTSWMVTKLIAEDIIRLIPRGTHNWGQYLNEEELRAWFGKQGGWGGHGAIKNTGAIYVPGYGWKMVKGGQQWGNYFFGIRKHPEEAALNKDA